ncbi:MAG: bifunctional ADP-dependent NAD(P)H-hydrate dehydratase/NAD(P)H-hydrate epimerase [Snowella sp.]|jgi:NAD(P)H-hydrate epimerase|nr:MAG: bifunctional ADP-dependent NAD(P)H-hydrate dehydratase/NAD(P)H-hydrate epimerase [Snowella sp.]
MTQADEIFEQVLVNAEQMRQVEEQLFANGMPVSALMEKAALLMSDRLQELYPIDQYDQIGILVGPGHNGGDALVIARELWLKNYQVLVYYPFEKVKELTACHAQYAQFLGIPFTQDLQSLQNCDVLIDGLFGFGLNRPLVGWIGEAIEQINQWSQPIVSIDLPSGLHTDTGEVLGIAIKATRSLCLGLWKLAFFQDQALEYLGKVEKLDFGIPEAVVKKVISDASSVKIVTPNLAQRSLPLSRSLLTHKYQQGHLLLICGSRRYAGGAILTGLGARASGVGMLSIAVPQSLKPLLVSHLPEALIIDCPETETGAIAELPDLAQDFEKYTVIAAGPGLTLEALPIIEKVLTAPVPLILDADGLNCLAQLGTVSSLAKRTFSTILTPHLGEFKRLFPEISHPNRDRLQAVQEAAKCSQAIILFKGARTVIANPDGQTWVIPESTPALARGGSGDVLTGLMGGILAQNPQDSLEKLVAIAAWWHAQAGILAVKERTELGVDAWTLSQYLIPTCQQLLS